MVVGDLRIILKKEISDADYYAFSRILNAVLGYKFQDLWGKKCGFGILLINTRQWYSFYILPNFFPEEKVCMKVERKFNLKENYYIKEEFFPEKKRDPK